MNRLWDWGPEIAFVVVLVFWALSRIAGGVLDSKRCDKALNLGRVANDTVLILTASPACARGIGLP